MRAQPTEDCLGYDWIVSLGVVQFPVEVVTGNFGLEFGCAQIKRGTSTACHFSEAGKLCLQRRRALLHKSAFGRASPVLGQNRPCFAGG